MHQQPISRYIRRIYVERTIKPMSYEEPGVGESFTIRIRKTIVTNPMVKWFNTYECRFLGEGSSEDLDSLALGLCEFEQDLLLNAFKIDQYTISTWAEDAHPYNPMSFVTVPVSMTGERAIGIGTPEDLRVTLFLKRTIESGRIGKLFLRGSLLMGDLTTFAGFHALASDSVFNEAIDDALTAGAITQNLEGGLSVLKLAIIGENGVTREIQDFALGGVVHMKMNHKYFDRS